MEQEAIYILYPTVKEIIQENETFKCLNENGSEVSIDMSAVNTKATELQNEADAKAQAKINNKANAKAKLIAGESLTEEEADTIVI